jgi:hypothetical protein
MGLSRWLVGSAILLAGCTKCDLAGVPGVQVLVEGADCRDVEVAAAGQGLVEQLANVSADPCLFEGLVDQSGAWVLTVRAGQASQDLVVDIPREVCGPLTQHVDVRF